MAGLRHILRLRRDDRGGALVEFGVVMPILLLLFALTIEASRTFWSYQATVAGVRDATRYMGRSVQTGICNDSSPSVAGWTATVTGIVRETEAGDSLFPASITIDQVTPSIACIAGGYRLVSVPMVTVSADLRITYPFAGVFQLIGVELPTVTTTVTDTGRVFGA